MKQLIKTENGPYLMQTRTRFTGCFAVIWLSLIIGAAIIFLGLYPRTEVVGELTWTKFPYSSYKPLWQRVCYKGERIYSGILSPAIDINLKHRNLLIINTHEGRKTYYDLAVDKKLDNTSVAWEDYYELIQTKDDRYITNIDSIDMKPEWKKLLLSYQHRTPPARHPKTEKEILTIAEHELGLDINGYTARYEAPYYYVELTEFEAPMTLGGGPALKINAFTGEIAERYFTE